MGIARRNQWGLMLGFLTIIGCSALSFHYYGLDGVTYENGTLLGPKPSDDLPFSACAPDLVAKNKCVVMFVKDFFAFKQDYEDLKMRLEECEKK